MTKRSRFLSILLPLLLSLGAPHTFADAPTGGVSVMDPSLEVTPEMKQFLEARKVSRRLPPIARMQSILDGLYDDNGGFVYGSENTLTAQEAFRQRKGNCVSFAMLFVTLAREVGLDARFNQIDYSPVWEEIGGILVEASHINVIVQVGGDQYVIEGIPEYTEVASRSRNPISDERVFSHYYNNSGLLALTRGEDAMALELIRKALDIDPSNGTAWQNLGLYRFRHGDPSGGEEALLEAAKLNSQSSSACFLLSQYYQKIGDDGKSKRFAKQGANRSRRNPFYHYYQSREALANGDIKKSIKHLERAIRLLPDYTKFKLELAKLKQGQNGKQDIAQAANGEEEEVIR